MGVKGERHRGSVTLKDIAEQVGVAVSTVSNAYNRPDQLSEALRTRILAAAEALGYAGPDPRARSLRRGTTTAIGVVYPSRLSYAFTDPMAALFIRGVAEEVEPHGYGLLLVGGPADDLADDAPTTAPAARAGVDGFVLHSFTEDDPLLQAALARKLPSVMVDDPGAAELPRVSIDDAGAAEDAMRHLLSLGHRRFGVLSLEFGRHAVGGLVPPERRGTARYRATRERLAGYRRAVEAAGLSWLDDVAVFESLDNTEAEGARGASLLAERVPRPTALLAMSDPLAFGALSYAAEVGLRVPHDLSVVGFDDVPGAARATPALTTVHQPVVRKGRAAGRLLLAALRGEPAPACVWLPTHLVVRASTGPAPDGAGEPAGG